MAGVKKKSEDIPGAGNLERLPGKVLLGCSAGVDSCALLQSLLALGRSPVLVHYNHGWRKESREEQRFIERLAERHGLKLITGAAPRGLPKTESAAREARWAFFAQASRQTRIRDLVLAHHADDQVETFLWQFLRGGGSGARGMRPLTRRGTLAVHRPWLDIWKRDIQEYARRGKWEWREDVSNQDTQHMRNRIRHRVLPYLRKHCGVRVDAALWRAAEILGEDQACLDALSLPLAAGREVSVAVLRKNPVALQRRILFLWLQARQVPDVGLAEVEAVRGLVERVTPAKINLPGNRHVRRRAGVLFVE